MPKPTNRKPKFQPKEYLDSSSGTPTLPSVHGKVRLTDPDLDPELIRDPDLIKKPKTTKT